MNHFNEFDQAFSAIATTITALSDKQQILSLVAPKSNVAEILVEAIENITDLPNQVIADFDGDYSENLHLYYMQFECKSLRYAIGKEILAGLENSESPALMGILEALITTLNNFIRRAHCVERVLGEC